jgi:hypothetical protein
LATERDHLHGTAILVTESTPIAKILPRQPSRIAKVDGRGCHGAQAATTPTAWDCECGTVYARSTTTTPEPASPGSLSLSGIHPSCQPESHAGGEGRQPPLSVCPLVTVPPKALVDNDPGAPGSLSFTTCSGIQVDGTALRVANRSVAASINRSANSDSARAAPVLPQPRVGRSRSGSAWCRVEGLNRSS